MQAKIESISSIRRECLAVWEPPPDVTLSEWADENAVLSPESSAEPGRWRTIPYQRGIMDAFTDPSIERVTLIKSARVGYTKILNNVIGYHIHQDPCPILVVQPTLDDANGYSKDEIQPMLRDTPVLAGLVADARSRDSGNTITKKSYPGGTLSIIGANSARGFRRITVRIVLFDEVDGYPPTAGHEGDQISLGVRRSDTFWNRKIAIGSTPTIKGASRVERSFNESDKRFYFVPCPHCGHFQKLEWKNLKWLNGDPQTAHFVCTGCGAAIEEKDKGKLIRRGQWRAEKPGGYHAGFHIWAAYSIFPNATWPKLVAEFLAVRKDPEQLKTFINTVLGETWEDQGDGVDEIDLVARAEVYNNKKLPREVLLLTIGVDVQGGKDPRLEATVIGWGVGEECWVVDHVIIPGDPERGDVWEQLDELIFETDFDRDDGVRLNISAGCIDSGFSTQAVYNYVHPRQSKRIYAIKGASVAGKPIVSKPSKASLRKGLKLYPVGVDAAKDVIFARLKIAEQGPKFIHFSDHLSDEYYRQLTAEKVFTTYRKGVPVREYKKTRVRNEALDTFVYNLAALAILNPRFEKIKRKQQPKAAEQEKDEAKPVNKKIRKRRPRRGGFANAWK